MTNGVHYPHSKLQPFPDAATVFCEEQAWLAQHFHPLVSIELSAIKPDWSGRIHLLNPIEPYEGYIGDYTTEFHNEFTGINWLAFELDHNSRYRFLGDRRYFALEHEHLSEASEWYLRDLREHQEKERKYFDFARERFQKFGGLYLPKRFKPLEKSEHAVDPLPLLDQLGGAIGSANWTSYPPPPSAFVINQEDDENVFPVTRSGDAFHFVAGVPGYNYCDNGADWIVLYFEPKSRIALMTFDWS
jgi:hypothetical protein